jgi:hypothetical protein
LFYKNKILISIDPKDFHYALKGVNKTQWKEDVIKEAHYKMITLKKNF